MVLESLFFRLFHPNIPGLVLCGTMACASIFSAIILFARKRKRAVLLVWILAYVFLMLYSTVIGRVQMDEASFRGMPFWSIKAIQSGLIETFYEKIYNIIFFVPYGILLVNYFKGKPIQNSVTVGFLTSVIIELLQLITRTGTCESDDVICNTLGCAIGATTTLAIFKTYKVITNNDMEQKTILVLTNNIGGLHSFRKEVMKAMIDEGYNVIISHPDQSEKGQYFTAIGCIDVYTKFNRRGMNPMKDLQLLMKYRKMIKKYKPLAVLTYTIKPNVYGGLACRLTNTPQIANVTGLGDAVENGGLLQKLTVFLYKIGIGKAKQVFFQNTYNRQFCIDKGIANETSVLLPGSGVNLNHHVYQEYPEDGVIKFLFIARMLKDKGTDEYFEAATRIKEKFPNTEFQILGTCEGNYQEKLTHLVSRGIVNFLGRTNDVRPFIGKVHCTIMPSYHEGMSNVNLESAANGRPVITTSVPGCKETVDDAVSGLLCEPRSAESLIASIEKFLNLSYEEKKAMGLAGRKKVELEFSRQIVVDKYLYEIKHE